MSKKKQIKILSPCIGVCELDIDDNFCIGCFRSTDEIAKWPLLDNQKALEIMEDIKKRHIIKKYKTKNLGTNKDAQI